MDLVDLPICECATVWPGQGHHPECPVRRRIEELEAALRDRNDLIRGMYYQQITNEQHTLMDSILDNKGDE